MEHLCTKYSIKLLGPNCLMNGTVKTLVFDLSICSLFIFCLFVCLGLQVP